MVVKRSLKEKFHYVTYMLSYDRDKKEEPFRRINYK